MRRWFFVGLLVLSLGLTIFGLMRPRGEQGLSVNVARAEQGEFVREVRATGTVEARLYTLTFARPGRVAEVRVREGQAVQAGQVLAVLDTADDEARLRAAREALRALQARALAQEAEYQSQLTRLQNQLGQAQRSLDISRQLLAVGGVAPREVDQLARQVADLEAQRASLKQSRRSSQQELQAQVQSRQSEIATLERSLAQARLRAPVEGTVASVGYLVGLEATAPLGSAASPVSPSIRLVEAGSLRVRARLSEADIPWVRPGQPVRIELDSAPEQPLEGKVDQLGVQAEVAGAGGSAVLPVLIRFMDNRAENLARPGLTATARITTLRLATATRIPLETLIEENGRTYVWVVDEANRTAKKQPITVKARNLTQAAVEGVADQSILISLPPEALKEGGKVSYRLPQAGRP